MAIDDSQETLASYGLPQNTQLQAHRDQDTEKQSSSPLALPRKDQLDWDGPDDAENPRNWSFAQRVFQTAPPALFSLIVVLASPIYTSATEQVSRDFHVSTTVAILGLSTQTIGFALGPALGAPLSETLGRLWVYRLSFPIFLIFTMATALSKNMASIMIFRLLAGIFGSPCLAVGAGTIGDLWDLQRDGGLAGALFVMAPFLGSGLGPILGGVVSYHTTWRWTLWFILLLGGPLYLGVVLFMKETFKPAILKMRAKKRGIELAPDGETKAKLEKLVTVTLLRPVQMLFTEPIVLAFAIYNSFAFGVLFAFFAAVPYSFAVVYHFDRRESGAVFTGIVVGVLLGVVTFGIIDRTIYRKGYKAAEARGEKATVETRLYGAMVGSVGLPVSLFMFAWTCRHGIHWIVPSISMIFFGWGNMLIFLSAVTYMVDVYQHLASASALAANGLMRYGLGAVFPLFTLQMYEAMGIAWATSLLGFVSLVLCLVPFVLFKFGHSLRLKSRFDTLKT